jgi:hypothetical protein
MSETLPLRRRAGRFESGRFGGQKNVARRTGVRTDYFPGGKARPSKIDGTGAVVLDPLAEVGIRVLVAVRIGRSQLMVNVLCNRKWSDRKQKED